MSLPVVTAALRTAFSLTLVYFVYGEAGAATALCVFLLGVHAEVSTQVINTVNKKLALLGGVR